MLDLLQKKVTFDLEHDYKTLCMYKKFAKVIFTEKRSQITLTEVLFYFNAW